MVYRKYKFLEFTFKLCCTQNRVIINSIIKMLVSLLISGSYDCFAFASECLGWSFLLAAFTTSSIIFPSALGRQVFNFQSRIIRLYLNHTLGNFKYQNLYLFGGKMKYFVSFQSLFIETIKRTSKQIS